MKIPSLGYTFHSAGFIDPEVIWDKEMSTDMEEAFESLSIDMVEVEDRKARGTGLPPFLQRHTLDSWTSIELFIVFKLSNE